MNIEALAHEDMVEAAVSHDIMLEIVRCSTPRVLYLRNLV
jgi:hypothetical protein